MRNRLALFISLQKILLAPLLVLGTCATRFLAVKNPRVLNFSPIGAKTVDFLVSLRG
jgi:hypothetical protein